MADSTENHERGGHRRESVRALLYRRYGQQVFEFSLAVQQHGGPGQARPLSDAEIAQRLGLSKADVIELRCVAETDLLDLDWFLEADEFKRKPR